MARGALAGVPYTRVSCPPLYGASAPAVHRVSTQSPGTEWPGLSFDSTAFLFDMFTQGRPNGLTFRPAIQVQRCLNGQMVSIMDRLWGKSPVSPLDQWHTSDGSPDDSTGVCRALVAFSVAARVSVGSRVNQHNVFSRSAQPRRAHTTGPMHHPRAACPGIHSPQHDMFPTQQLTKSVLPVHVWCARVRTTPTHAPPSGSTAGMQYKGRDLRGCPRSG